MSESCYQLTETMACHAKKTKSTIEIRVSTQSEQIRDIQSLLIVIIVLVLHRIYSGWVSCKVNRLVYVSLRTLFVIHSLASCQ